MADITITVPDALVPRVLNAVAETFSYDPAVNGTKAAFTKQCMIRWLKNVVVNYEQDQAAKAAGTSADTDIVIT